MAKTINDLGGYGVTNDQYNLYTALNNQKTYQDYINQQKNNYKSITDNPIKWLAMGLKGEGWNEDDYLKNRGLDADTRKLGAAGQLSSSDIGKLADYGRSYDTNLGKELEGGRRLFSGIPLIGEILNPWAQVASAGKDLATSGVARWQNGKRDVWSDVGALGEAAFDVAGMGTLGNAVKGGAKLGANVGKTALRTGVLGAGENAFATLREGGKDTQLGDIATSAALGGTIGAGIGTLSQLGGNAANMAKNLRSPQTKQMANAYSDFLTKKNSAIQDTARLLGDGAGGATIGTKGTYYMPQQLKTAMTRMDTPLARTGLGRVAQGIADSNAIYGSPLSKIANSKLGKTTKNILSTKTGKIGAGVGGGLLIAKLLSGGGNNAADNELSDAELEALLTNYYNNGGY